VLYLADHAASLGVSGTTLAGEAVSVMSASKRMFHVDRTAASATQCGSKPVSGRGLRKTGIFRRLPRDFRRFRRESGQIRSLETDNQFAKARYWRAFIRLLGVVSLSVGLVGWRRSADRTSLQANSLVSGNFTGNFAILGLKDTI
jgi:hypothetical protein